MDEVLQEIKAMRVDMHKLLGTRLDHTEMADRLQVNRRTLYNRIQAGTVPRPKEGKWLLADVVQWENQ